MEALTGWYRDELIGARSRTTSQNTGSRGIELVLGKKKVTDYELTGARRDGNGMVSAADAADLSIATESCRASSPQRTTPPNANT